MNNSTTEKPELKPNATPDSSEAPESPTSSSATSSGSAESSSSSEMMSIDGSCVSSEADDHNDTSSPESDRSSPMVLVGCPRCLMYVMLSEASPKCPKCKSTVLLDFLNQGVHKKTGAA